MFQEIVTQAVRKILGDKILLGLLIVCLLGVFVGGFSLNRDRGTKEDGGQPEQEQPVSSSNNSSVKSSVSSKDNALDSNYKGGKLTPDLAVAFVKWWIRQSMDFTPNSAAQSHQAADHWMTPGTAKSFDAAFWNPQLASQVTSGSTVGAFQPISVVAKAINPDGTIVVNVTGTLVLQMGSRPSSHQIEMDVLVCKESRGLRVSGFYNRLTSVSNSIY